MKYKTLFCLKKIMTKKYLTELTYEIIGAAIEVHKIIGPGLLETVYQKCLSHEISLRGLYSVSELYIPVIYKDLEMDTTFRCDLLVEDAIVVELKAIDATLPIHAAILLNHMNLLEKPKGIMLNFKCANLF
jgi:GxxExxY protein